MKDMGGNAPMIKEINTDLVRRTLKDRKRSTVRQIAQTTGLSIVTVTAVLQELTARNEVMEEADLVPSGGGRPARGYRYNYDFRHAAILYPREDQAHMMIHSAVINLAGQPVSESDTAVDRIDLSCLESILSPMIAADPRIRAIGLGHPGVELDKKIIVSDCEMLLGTSPASYLESRYHLPVVVENDVNCAAAGFGEGKDPGVLVYLYFSDRRPPGAGIIIDGMLYKGKANFAGEVKSIPLGIEWNQDLYRSSDSFCQAAARLITAVSSVLNPELVVVNGGFIELSHIAAIMEYCHDLLPPEILPIIFRSDTFMADYQRGLSKRTLALLASGLTLINKSDTIG